jgi:hypothetical protein
MAAAVAAASGKCRAAACDEKIIIIYIILQLIAIDPIITESAEYCQSYTGIDRLDHYLTTSGPHGTKWSLQ